MRVIAGTDELGGGKLGPSAVGIGVFDGVHLGHRTLLKQVEDLAADAGLESVACTFNPHPARVLNPELAPRLIQPLEERLAEIAGLGLGATVVEPFTRELAAQSADQFVARTLVGALHARHVVVGADFTFGAGQRGNVESLQHLGRQHGFHVHPVEQVRVEGIVVSSTKIREFTRNGRVRGAAMLLGRPLTLTGVAQQGKQRGSKLGFPTANVQTRNELMPAPGVYVAAATGSFGKYGAVVNVGFNPTFGDTSHLKLEAHLLGYGGGPLYGEVVAVAFLDRLRDERRFESVDDLREQIRKDVEEAARRLDEDLRR
jgi:riboflavin kinase/FMN adenylyltransferase